MRKDIHSFGGPWTEQKLDILSGYLQAFSTALSKQKFSLEYIDAFAGTGTREASAITKSRRLRTSLEDQDGEQGTVLSPLNHPGELGGDDGTLVGTFKDGSARIALKTVPPFNVYRFVEIRQERCEQLLAMKSEFPDLADSIRVDRAEANSYLKEICAGDWTHRRAVLFLDPYGLQVEWSTLEAVAQTGAIDMWLLFPLSGVNRMLTANGHMQPGWKNRIDLLFGVADWQDALYMPDQNLPLFDQAETPRVKAGIEVLARFFISRLKTVFPAVEPRPAILRNTQGSPLFLFCFACSSPNPKAQAIALRIARHLLKVGS